MILLLLPLGGNAQDSANSRGAVFEDKFLDSLVGDWNLKRSIRGTTAESTLVVKWVLDHRFLYLEMRSKEANEYSADIYIGYDHVKKQYVLHWIDTWGGLFSETLGYGRMEGDALIFDFAYPDGAFRNTFTRNSKNDTWRFLMQIADGKGGWKLFAEDQLARKK